MNSNSLDNQSMRASLIPLSAPALMGDDISRQRAPLLEEFLRNLSKYSQIYAQIDRDPALTSHLFLVGKRVRNHERIWTKLDLVDVIRWRRLHSLAKRITPSAAEIEQLLNEALTASDGDDKVQALCEIKGFGPVLASAISTLTWPDSYGLLDYHTWTAIRSLGFDVSERQFSGGGFTVPEYAHFLAIIRELAQHAESSPAQTTDALYAFDNARRRHGRA